jgi:UDP-N-acetyl-D-mannosaminuronate dehydrogenase
VHIVGVAYKPGVADMRDSPALEVIEGLIQLGATVSFTDEYIPVLAVAGQQLRSLPGDQVVTDLVLVHTRHPGTDLSWVAGHAQVLDATYRLDEVAHRAVL